MATFTYFFRKLDPQPEQKEIRKKVVKYFEKTIDSLRRFICIDTGDLKPDDDERDMLEFYPFYNDLGWLKEKIEVMQKCIKKIKDRKAEKAIRKKYVLAMFIKEDCKLHLIDDDFYILCSGEFSSSPFRTPLSSTEILRNFNEFTKFYETPGNHCYISGNSKITTKKELYEYMKHFWETYPEGKITFNL